MTKKRGNMSQFPLRMQAEFDREEIYRLIESQPGITMQQIADAVGKAKSTAHQQTAILISTLRVVPVALSKRGSLGYYIVTDMSAVNPKLEEAGRFDNATVIVGPAVDGAKLPEPCPLMSALFGRTTKETL